MLFGSAETGASREVSGALEKHPLWRDGVLVRLIRDAMRIECDSKTFLSQYYDAKSYSSVINPMLTPSPVQLWLHLDGSAARNSERFVQVLETNSVALRNGETISTGNLLRPCFAFLSLHRLINLSF